MGKDFVTKSKDASKGGFRGIKKVRGLVVNMEKVPPPEGWETEKDQIQVSLEDATVLEMFEGEDECELKEGKFNFLYPYAEGDAKPSANGPYMRCLVASAEKFGKDPTDYIGQVTTFEKLPVVLFKQRDKKQPKGEDGKYPLVEVIAENYFSIIEDETADSENVRTHTQERLNGLTQKASLRALLTDTRLKQYPELKEKLQSGTLAEYLEMEIVDGKFVMAAQDDAPEPEEEKKPKGKKKNA